MKKIAIFVEGQTESLFVERLLVEIAGERNIRVDKKKIFGGSKVSRQIVLVREAAVVPGQNFYALIYDCGSDNQVKSRIEEEHVGLTKSGYSLVIGLRDVRPIRHSDLPKLELGLRTGIRTSLVPVVFVLSVMEIEAWFLAETEHFIKVDPRITLAEVIRILGLDPSVDSLETRPTPAEDLHDCYQVGGKAYRKRHAHAERTVNALDYTSIYLTMPNRIPYLRSLVAHIEGFLT